MISILKTALTGGFFVFRAVFRGIFPIGSFFGKDGFAFVIYLCYTGNKNTHKTGNIDMER